MKLKPIAALLLAVCIIVLGAMLPVLVARRQDNAGENQVQFTRVNAVELEFSRNEQSQSQTLAILADPRDMVEIPRDLAAMKPEKIEKIVLTTAEKYRDSGVLLADIDSGKILDTQTYLYYGRENQSNIFWIVRCADTAGTYAASIIIDDRTGIVCSVEYASSKEEYAREDMARVLESFAGAYIAGLGDEFYHLSAQDVIARAQSAQDGSYVASELSWEAAGYAEGRLTLFVNRTGFYTYFP